MKQVIKNTLAALTPVIMLQQACVPHYRQRLFETLAADRRFHFVVLADRLADVSFLRLSDTTGGFDWQPAKQHTIRLPGGLALSWQPRVLTTVLRARPDIVIAQGSPYDVTAWSLALMGRLLGMAVLLWTHGLQREESGIKWLVRKGLYRLASGLLLYGDHAKRLLIRRGSAGDRLHVVYNSLDAAEQEAVFQQITEPDREAFRHSLGMGPHERLICFTGRLQPVKRLPWLLQALSMVNEQGQRVHLVLVGDGDERSQLERLSAELGLTGLVHFLGAVYDETRVGLAISASDLAVVPSGAGLTVMHALAYGTPVLLHDKIEEHFPEWEAVREGQTGWFYRYGDLSDCANKIMAALFPRPQKDLMAPACRSMIESRYNTTAHARAFIDALAQYCSLGPLVKKDPTASEALMPSGPLRPSGEGRRGSC